MKHRYIVFLSFIVVIMFSIMSFSQIDFSGNNDYNSINPDIDGQTYGWRLAGTTSIHANNNSEATLTIDVTSYEASSSRPTVMCFAVSNNTESCYLEYGHVSGTGVYTYHWHYNLYGEVHLSARYVHLCTQHLLYTIHSMSGVINSPNPPPGGYYHQYFAEFGDSSAYLSKPLTLPKTVLDYIGYEGNGSIYLSNIVHQPTYCVYGNVNITDSSGIYHGNNIANKSIIVGKTAYIESDNGKCLYISLNLTDIGAGAQSCSFDAKSGLSTCTRPYEIITDLQTSGAPSDVSVQFCNNEEVGYNVTNMDSKSATEMQDEVSLIGDGFSLIPVAGYAVTGAMAAGTAYSLIHCVTTKPVKGSATDNNPADIKYCITGGSMSRDSYVKNGQNVYASGIEANIKVPNSQLNSNFKIEIEYATEYQCGLSLITAPRATTTQTINATPASAIYGSVTKLNNLSQPGESNISSLYIENPNTHTFYNATIKNGTFLFFAQPDTEYKLYYMDNGKLHEFYHIDNGEMSKLSSFNTNSAGASTHIDILY
jgi:fructose-specific component phosphotransferase system IIB-like protein